MLTVKSLSRRETLMGVAALAVAPLVFSLPEETYTYYGEFTICFPPHDLDIVRLHVATPSELVTMDENMKVLKRTPISELKA